MGSGLFGASTAGEDAAGSDSLGAVWADSEPAVTIRPKAARKAQRDMQCLRYDGIKAANGEGIA
jgi:hypothetical protein